MVTTSVESVVHSLWYISTLLQATIAATALFELPFNNDTTVLCVNRFVFENID